MNFVFCFAVKILKMNEFGDFEILEFLNYIYFPLKQFDYRKKYN